jgi:hypothetical protein
MLPSMGSEHDVSIELLTSDPSGGPSPFDWSQLEVQRHVPKAPAGDLPSPRPVRLGSKGSMPPYDGIPSQIAPGSSWICLKIPQVATRARAMYGRTYCHP